MSAMTIDQAKQEMHALKVQLETAINGWHERTGLPVDIYIHGQEVTAFNSKSRQFIYQAVVSMQLGAVEL